MFALSLTRYEPQQYLLDRFGLLSQFTPFAQLWQAILHELVQNTEKLSLLPPLLQTMTKSSRVFYQNRFYFDLFEILVLEKDIFFLGKKFVSLSKLKRFKESPQILTEIDTLQLKTRKKFDRYHTRGYAGEPSRSEQSSL